MRHPRCRPLDSSHRQTDRDTGLTAAEVAERVARGLVNATDQAPPRRTSG